MRFVKLQTFYMTENTNADHMTNGKGMESEHIYMAQKLSLQ